MPYSALEDKKTELIRKSRTGSVFIAPYASTAITAITTTGSDLASLPTGYEDLGWTSTDGVSYGRATTASEVNSFGSVEPTRTDITKDVVTMQVTAQETKLLTMGLYTGTDTTGLTADHTTGEVYIDKPERPAVLHYRVLGLFLDESDDGEIYFARFFPKARITEFGEQKYDDGDGSSIIYQMTWTGFQDATYGTSHRWLWGGPGWAALLASMSITQA